MHKKYPNILGILETSAATGAGIEALKTAIANQVDALPHVRDLLPETWFSVKDQLETIGREQNYISHEKYLSLCEKYAVTDAISQRTLIGFLHDLGVILHFQDDPRLEALGILNPQWVTNGVYKILNAHALFQNKGVLTLPMLDEILDLPEYPHGKRMFIVDMMKKFELCYDIEPDRTFLVPDLLPKDEPFTGDWAGALAFQYHYNVLPSSIITRFIVRMNAFIHKTIWRAGVVLKQGGNMALVKADTEDRKIFIWVGGDEPTRRDFLSAIRAAFEAIHKTIARIEATEKVPIPGYPDVEPLDFAFLLQAEREGRATVPVMAGDRLVDVNVRELLNGISPESARRARAVGMREPERERPVPVRESQASKSEPKEETISLNMKTAVGFTLLVLFALAGIVSIFAAVALNVDFGQLVVILIASLLVFGLLLTGVFVSIGKATGKDFTTVVTEFFKGVGLLRGNKPVETPKKTLEKQIENKK